VNIRRATGLVTIVALIGAFGASAQEPPVSHLWLSLGPVRLGDGWTLVASGTAPDFENVGYEILGVTLERKLSSRARETHALRPHLDEATFSFDGREGRWQTAGRAGSSLAVDMVIRASGEPEAVAADEPLPFGCRGPFERVRVTLTGVFSVRTGTKAFKNIERRRLTGVMTYARGGQVECGGLSAPPRCAPSTYLTVSGQAAKGSQSLVVDRGRRSLVAQFSDGNQWSHVMALTRVGVLSGDLPRIRLRIPAGLPVLGSAVFVAGRTTETGDGGCTTRVTEGSFSGSLRVRFSAWGERTFGRPPSRGRISALYRVTKPA
jgi:hypothetical protein